MRHVKINFNGKDLIVPALKYKGQLWFHYNGENYQYQPEVEGSRAGAKAGGDPSRIQAPMPGKIIKILVQEEEIVQEGQTLVAMEAMKMEYNLKSLQEMKVTKIKCKEQQIVSLGDTLVELEENV